MSADASTGLRRPPYAPRLWVLAATLAAALLGANAWTMRAQGQVPVEPWIVEGDSLWGARDQGSEIENPRVRHGGLRVSGDRGRIDAARTFLFLTGSVRIEDSLGVVRADQGIYRRYDRMLDLVGNVSGFGRNGRFRAAELTYDRRLEIVDLRGRPELTDSTRVIWADRVRFRSGTSQGEAHGDVRVLLLADSTWISGEHAFYDGETGAISITGSPWLYRPGLERAQDLTVWADTLAMDERERKGRATGNVRILRGEVQAVGREARFELVRNRTVLTGSPVAWDREGEIRADTMDIRVRSGTDDLLRAYGNVSVDYRPRANPGEIQFVLGDTLDAAIVAGQVRSLEAVGNAHSLYLPSVDEIRLGTGQNLSRARRIRLVLEEGGDHVDLVESASGEYRYPSARNVRRLRDPAVFDSLARFGGVRLFPDMEESRSDSTRPAAPSAGGNDRAPSGEERAAPHAAALPGGEGRSASPAPPDSALGALRPAAADSLADAEGRALRDARSRVADAFAPPRPERTIDAKEIDPRLAHFRRERSLDFPESLRAPIETLLDESVIYLGDTIRFYSDEDRLSIRGNGRLEYQESRLVSSEIDYFADDELVVAVGEPKLSDRGTEVVGERMTYRTDDREGMIYQGRTAYEGGFYYGKEIKKLSGDELLVRDGEYTTCSEDPPHYSFHSEKMKLLIGEKAVARPVVLHIRGVPVLAIPYYFFPLEKGRQSGFLFPTMEFGFNRNRGRFVRNLGYYLAMSDYADAKAWFDYYDRGPEWRLNGEFNYALRYRFRGGLTAGYVDDRVGARSKRWSLRGDHSQEIDERTSLKVRANFQSDKSYVQDYDLGAGVDERLNRQLESSASFSRSWSGGRLGVDATRTQFLDETSGSGLERRESYPSINLSLNQVPLGRDADDLGRGGRLPFLSSVYFGSSVAFRHEVEKRFGEQAEENSASALRWSLGGPQSLGPYLRLSPSINGTVAWFYEDVRGEKNGIGANWNSSLSLGNTLYGTLPFAVGPLEGLRHVVEPSVSYNYRPEFRSLTVTVEDAINDSVTVEREVSRFPSVGGISLGGGGKQSSLSLTLNQRIHTKWKVGEQVVKKENVLTWSTGTSYDFLAEGPNVKRWRSLGNNVQLRPIQTFDLSYDFTVDPYEWTSERFDLRSNLRISSTMFERRSVADTTGSDRIEYGELGQTEFQGADLGNREAELRSAGSVPWSLGLSHSYSGRRGDDARDQRLSASLRLVPSGRWEVSGSAYYDLAERSFVSHSFTLNRDLHCWNFFFEYSSTGTYYFRIQIRDIPEVKYETDGG